MRVLHTEASIGFGGQEIRILREALGLKARGHQIILAVKRRGALVYAAQDEGLEVYEMDFEKKKAFHDLMRLLLILRRCCIQIINTHSSWDSWIGGIAGRLSKTKVLRTRHLSTAIRPGLNSRVLYKTLADRVVTTCEATAAVIRKQALLDEAACFSVPTGVDPSEMQATQDEAHAFRKEFGIRPEQLLVGTVCVLRSWKGIHIMLKAAQRLLDVPHLRWVVVGDGPARDYFKRQHLELGLGDRVLFTGYLAKPFAAIAAMDLFVMLSTANEGVSQAVLQAAQLGKPLVTTDVGGLPEVCIEGQTGRLCPPGDANAVAEAVRTLLENPLLRETMGKEALRLVSERFTFTRTLDQMEVIYDQLVQRV